MTLHEQALLIVGEYRRNEKALIDILTKIDQTRAYLELGYSSLFRYCVEKLELTESETYRFTQVTRKSYEVPQLKEAIARGTLSVSQASRIAGVIQVETSDRWIQKAQELKQRDLEREVKKDRPEIIFKPRLNVINASQSELKIVISKDLEQKLLRLQEVLRTTDLNQTLEKMADYLLKQKDPLEKAKRNGFKLPASRKVGTSKISTRAIPTEIKYKVILRDHGKCNFKNCGEKRWTETHHLRPVAMGGRNELDNLTTLCWAHHRYLHKNGPNNRVNS